MPKRYLEQEIFKRMKSYQNWNRIPAKKEKIRAIAAEVLDVIAEHHDADTTYIPPHLEGFNRDFLDKLIRLDEMGEFIAQHSRGYDMIELQRRIKIKNEELKELACLQNPGVIGAILSGCYGSSHQTGSAPWQFWSAELLKATKYPNMSYNKFFKDIINNTSHQEDRAFVGLSLKNKCERIHPSSASAFRKSLQLHHLINLTTYSFYICMKVLGKNPAEFIAVVDSTDVSANCSFYPTAEIEYEGGKVGFFSEFGAMKGVRRNKKDKSKYFVGYRKHSVILIDPVTVEEFPFVSIATPANVHDSQAFSFLAELAVAIGVPTSIFALDTAYLGEAVDNACEKLGIFKVCKGRDDVSRQSDTGNGNVYIDDLCETPMKYDGICEGRHQYCCSADISSCPFFSSCEKFREIPTDAGEFCGIPHHIEHVEEVMDLRKHCERNFNTDKNMNGVSGKRFRGIDRAQVQFAFSDAATLLRKAARKRAEIKQTKRKYPLFEGNHAV